MTQAGKSGEHEPRGEPGVYGAPKFDTADPALRGTMTMTTTLSAADGGTDVLVVHEGVPGAVPAADNEAGTRMALGNLARLVEADQRSG